jgi:hypothetical protein
MAKTTTATPSKAKASSSIDASLAREFVAVIGGSLEGEAKAFWKLHSQVAQGILSVRGARETVKEAEQVGALPSFRSSWCEDILTVGILAKVEGGQSATLKHLFAIAVQGRKVHKTKGLLKVIKDAPSLEAIEATIPKQGERGEGKKTADEKKASKGKVMSVDEMINALGLSLKGGATPKDTKRARLLVAELQKAIKKVEAVEGVKAVVAVAA